jgi:myo-inositol-1-phosphate synthase
MTKIRVALLGVGNSASAFVQGQKYYSGSEVKPGLWHHNVGGYAVGDIEVVAAFDIDSRKVGLDLSDAIRTRPNVAPQYLELGRTGVVVMGGFLEDEIPPTLMDALKPINGAPGEMGKVLEEKGVEVVLSLISSGEVRSSRRYAETALKSGCCFINCTPAEIVVDKPLVDKFAASRLVVVGDDLMSQLGGTSFHRGVLHVLHGRGISVSESYQLDVSGGTETLNTMNEDVKELKKGVKRGVIASELPYEFRTTTGTTDYVDFMGNDRTSYFWISGRGFMGSEVKVDIYLKTTDGPNAGNILLDAVRAVKAAKDNGEVGAPHEICSYCFKRAPERMTLDESYRRFYEKYVA